MKNNKKRQTLIQQNEEMHQWAIEKQGQEKEDDHQGQEHHQAIHNQTSNLGYSPATPCFPISPENKDGGWRKYYKGRGRIKYYLKGYCLFDGGLFVCVGKVENEFCGVMLCCWLPQLQRLVLHFLASCYGCIHKRKRKNNVKEYMDFYFLTNQLQHTGMFYCRFNLCEPLSFFGYPKKN